VPPESQHSSIGAYPFPQNKLPDVRTVTSLIFWTVSGKEVGNGEPSPSLLLPQPMAKLMSWGSFEAYLVIK
jgi:hypothetical protein